MTQEKACCRSLSVLSSLQASAFNETPKYRRHLFSIDGNVTMLQIFYPAELRRGDRLSASYPMWPNDCIGCFRQNYPYVFKVTIIKHPIGSSLRIDLNKETSLQMKDSKLLQGNAKEKIQESQAKGQVHS